MAGDDPLVKEVWVDAKPELVFTYFTDAEQDGGTLVRLVHRDLPQVERDGHSRGWDYHLERLRRDAVGLDPGDAICPSP